MLIDMTVALITSWGRYEATVAPQLTYDKQKNKVLPTCLHTSCPTASPHLFSNQTYQSDPHASQRRHPIPSHRSIHQQTYRPDPILQSTNKPINQIIMRVFTPSAAKQLALSPLDVRRSDPRTGEEVRRQARWSPPPALSYFSYLVT